MTKGLTFQITPPKQIDQRAEAEDLYPELQSGTHLDLRLWRDHAGDDPHAVRVFKKNVLLGTICDARVARVLDAGQRLTVMVHKPAASPRQPPTIFVGK